MVSEKEFRFLSEIKEYGDLGVEEFIYLLCEESELGADYLNTFLNEYICLNGRDKLVDSLQNINIGEDSKLSITGDLEKFFTLFPLSVDTPYASTSLLYYLMTSNDYKIRNAFTYRFQKFFSDQGLKNVDKLYATLKAKLEDETSLGNLVKDAKNATNSQNRDKNIEYAIAMQEVLPAFQSALKITDHQIADDAQQAFLQRLREARKKLKTAPEIAAILKSNVLSQNDVCDKMGEILFSLVNNFSLLENKKTPIARMLFCGPSGTGKTLLAQTIAKEFFDTEVLLIPCSQYQDSISANRLFGSSPGYVGYDDDTPLQAYLRNIKKQGKKGVIIFDEIEKMHKSVLNSLLSALDGNDFTMHSKTSGNETLNLKNCLIVGTSNLASDELGKEIARLGFQTSSTKQTEQDKFSLIKSAAQKLGISTEFFNRFEHVFSFNRLNEADYKKIAKKQCEETIKQIKAKLPQLKVKIDDTAIAFMAKLAKMQGDNTRVIESITTDDLDHLISNYLLTNENSEKGTITISAENGKLCANGSASAGGGLKRGAAGA